MIRCRTLAFAVIYIGATVLAGCAAERPAAVLLGPDGFFQRYTAPSPQTREREIEDASKELSAARARGNQAAALQTTAELGEMLTTARREQEARAILSPALEEARAQGPSETMGWLLLNLATANQYLHRRSEAAEQFPAALELARTVRSQELEHYTLQHWGRFLAESGDLVRARACFSQALALRIKLNDPLQASSRRALGALDGIGSATSP